MVATPFPTSPGELTPEWLTHALHTAGVLAAARVTGCRCELVGAGQGFSGQLARVGLTYDRLEVGAPASLIAKFQVPPLDPDIRAAVLQSRLFEREYRFYTDIARAVALRTPRLYFGAIQEETTASTLLLEDLAPAHTRSLFEGCPVEDAALVVRQLAGFHAAWWEQPRLDGLDWLPAFDAQAEDDQRLYVQAWELFLSKVGHLLPDGLAALGVQFRPHVAAVKRYLGASPRTLLHGDFHLHNLLFDSTGDSRTVAVIDWQACARGRGTRDLVHFLVTGLLPDSRRAHELDLLRLYHTTLTEHGVANYSLAQCRHDYRFTLLDELHFLVLVLAHLDYAANAAAGPIRDLAIERIGAALLDHRPGELLPG